MTTTKLKIDLTQGTLEVEGNEAFVREIYQDFKGQFNTPTEPDPEKPKRRSSRRKQTAESASLSRQSKTPNPEPGPNPEPSPEPAEVVTSVVVNGPEETAVEPPRSRYTYLADLDLDGTLDGQPSLVEFMDSKLPITNEERNLVFLYYLQFVVAQDNITLDHLYTCYRKAKIRAPQNMAHSVQMTMRHYGWLSGPNDSLTVTPEGKAYVDEQLPQTRKN